MFILGSTAFCGGSNVVFSGVLGKVFLTPVLVTGAELHLSQLVAALYFWDTRAGRTPGPAGGQSSRERAAEALHGACPGSREQAQVLPGALDLPQGIESGTVASR